MSSFDNASIPTDRAGCLFFLERPSEVPWVEPLSTGEKVRLERGGRFLIVEEVAEDIDRVTPVARRLAQEALDLMAVRSAGSLRLSQDDDAYCAWGPRDSQRVLRVVTTVPITWKVSAGGGPQPYPVKWHPSMRFFRMSQVTDDLFDAFRNVYLALESILSHLHPVRLRPNGRPAETESDWTRRALAVAAKKLLASNSGMTFDRYLSHQGSLTPVDDVFEELYRQIRTQSSTRRPAALSLCLRTRLAEQM